MKKVLSHSSPLPQDFHNKNKIKAFQILTKQSAIVSIFDL